MHALPRPGRIRRSPGTEQQFQATVNENATAFILSGCAENAMERAKGIESEKTGFLTLTPSVAARPLCGQNIAQHGQWQAIPTMRDVDAVPNGVVPATEQSAIRNRIVTEPQPNTDGVAGALGSLLPELLAVWPKVPEAVKTGILAMIQAAVITAQDE